MIKLKEIDSLGQKILVTEEIAEICEYAKTFSDAEIALKYTSEIMVEIFNITYLRDIRDYYSSIKIATSNWTHHTANTFFRTCQLLDLKCDFEVENRHDGAIREEDGKLFLCAEWEIDERSIFSENGELNKLFKTCKKHENCEAFLFTYNVRTDFKEFLKKVFTQWNLNYDQTDYFRLFLVTAIFDDSENSKLKFLKGLRTFIIGNGTIDIWEDLK